MVCPHHGPAHVLVTRGDSVATSVRDADKGRSQCQVHTPRGSAPATLAQSRGEAGTPGASLRVRIALYPVCTAGYKNLMC